MSHRWLAMLVVMQGCAFQQAMREGQRLSDAGDWKGAYAAYSTALDKKPGDDEAEQARERAREYAVEDALTAARSAIDVGDYETAKQALEGVTSIDADNPEVFELSRDLEQAMAAHFERLWQANDPAGAYDFAVRAKALVPKAPHVDENLDRVRGYYLAESERMTGANQHARALELLATITAHEPARKTEVLPLEQKVRVAWADHLVETSATLAKGGRVGAAAVQLARAYEIAGRGVDLARAKELAASLTERGRFSVSVEVTGDSWRVAPVKQTLTQGVAALPDATLVQGGEPVLAVKMALKPHRCTETDAVTPATLDYISGQVEKPNPAWVEAAAAYEQARKEEAAAKARSEELWPKLQTAESLVQKLEGGVGQLSTLLNEVSTAFEEATRQLQATRARRDDIEAQVDATLAAGGDPKPLQAQLVETVKIMDQWAAKTSETEQAEGIAKQKLAALTQQRDAATSTLEQLRAEYAQLTQERSAAQVVAGDLTAKLASTPKTVWEDVPAVLKYDVHDWTRVCTAPVALTMRPRWKTALGTARNFEPTATIQDRSYAGNTKANLVADPKKYPTSDQELVALADAETTKAVLEWTATLADDAYQDRLGATIRAVETAPVDAATAVLALLLGAPGRLDEASKARFHEYLKKEFGLEQPSLIVNTGS